MLAKGVEIKSLLYEDFSELKKRIDDYDSAASDKSVCDKWTSSFTKWGLRSSLGYLGDQYVGAYSDSEILNKFNQQVPTIYKPLVQTNDYLKGKLESYNINACSYKKLLGIGENKIVVSPEEYLENYKSLFSKKGIEAYKTVIKDNFEDFLTPEKRQAFSIKSYIKQTLVGENIKSLADPFSKSQLCTTVARSLGVGLLGYGIYSKTRDSYLESKAQNDSKFTTIGKIAYTFAGQATKGIICWELGSIGAAIGSAIFCIGFWPSLIGGIATGALFGAVGYKLLSKIIPDPICKTRYQ